MHCVLVYHVLHCVRAVSVLANNSSSLNVLKKDIHLYLLPGCRDTNSICGIIPVKAGWLVSLSYCHRYQHSNYLVF